MSSDEPSVEAGDQLQMQADCPSPISLAADQCDIRFDVCSERTGIRPGEVLRDNEWQVHPASMAEPARQRQQPASQATDAGLCRIAHPVVRGDWGYDAAYPAIRH